MTNTIIRYCVQRQFAADDWGFCSEPFCTIEEAQDKLSKLQRFSVSHFRIIRRTVTVVEEVV